MNKERLQEVLKILDRFNSNKETIDYYELFGFNKNATLEEIKAQIKSMKLQVLFHPDQISFVPTEHHPKYLKMIEVVKDTINVFDNYRNKEAYDQKLKEPSKANNNYNSNHSSNSAYNHNPNNSYYSYNNSNSANQNDHKYSYNNNNNYNANDHKYSYNNNNNYNQTNGYNQNTNNNQADDFENKTQDLEEIYLQQAIISNSQKHGFEFAKQALKEAIENNYFGGFTKTDNARDIAANIGRDKIMELVSKASINDNNIDLDQIIMNYFSDIMCKNPILKSQMNYVEQACVKTIYKYDLDGEFGQTRQALNDYAQYGNASHFTNTDNARVNLINNVKYQDVPFIIKCSLNSRRHEIEYFTYNNLKHMSNSEVCNIYTSDLYGRMRSNQYYNTNEEYNGNNGYGR